MSVPDPGQASQSAVELLRESEARLRAVIETAVDGIVISDAHGSITMYNAACERLFGFTAAEAIGQNVKLLMPAPYREEHDRYIRNYRESGVPKIIGIGREVVGRRKDGTTFPMDLSVGEAKLASGSVFVGIIKDITLRKRAEQRTRELQDELLHVSRLSAMGEMASSLAHELNQPLTAVMNYAQAARRMLQQGQDANVTRAMDTMEKAVAQASRAGQIIRRMRDFVAKGETDRTEEDLNRIVHEASQLGLVGAAARGVRVTFDPAPDRLPVLVDRIQIQQVVLNLVRNGLEAMEATRERAISIATAAAGAMVEVAVADAGGGLDPDVARRLFQPFVTTKPTGMGLGLSICRSIVESHGGRIWAGPNEGGGTVFRFSLPAAPDGNDAR
jgi:two-component system, LuxR family, sensor kinase FixL